MTRAAGTETLIEQAERLEVEAASRSWKPYGAYRESGVEGVNALPAHWEVKPLKRVVAINPEDLADATDPDYELEYLDIGNVSLVEGITGSELYRFEDAPSRARRRVRHGDTIISTVRPYLKAVARISDPPSNLIVSTGFAVLRPDGELDSGFLYRLVQSEAFVGRVVAHSTGVSYPAIAPTQMGRFDVWLPPLLEQRAIAAFLDRKTRQIDELIEKKRRLIDLLQEKRTALISHAVTKGLNPDAPMKPSGIDWLGDVPEHWNIERLKALFTNLNHRRVPISAEIRGGMSKAYPYYGASGIIDYVEDYIFDEPLLLVAEDGANLLSRSTPLAFVASGQYWVNNHAHILRPRVGPLSFWESLLQLAPLEPLVTGSAQPKLTKENLGTLPLPVPPLDEQQQIGQAIDSIRKRYDGVIGAVGQGLEQVKEYRQSLISDAVTGKIDVREEVPS